MKQAFRGILEALRLDSWERRAMAAIVACAVLAYATCLWGDFVFDDRHTVSENAALLSLTNVPAFFVDVDMFSSLNIRMYRPVLLTSYALNAAIGGMEPWIFKLTNLLIHVGCGLLLFQIARLLSAARVGALCGALLFAVHPLASEAINTISGRSNLLMVFGLLLAMRFHLSAMSGNRWANLGTLFAGVVACGSKEPGIILPVLLVVLEVLRMIERRALAIRTACLRILPVVLLVLGYLLLRKHLLLLTTFNLNAFHGGVDVHTGYGRDMATQLATMALLLPRTLLDFIVPLRLTMDPPVAYTDDWLAPQVLGGMLLLAVLTFLGLCRPRRLPLLFLGTCLAWGTALPWVIKPLNVPYLEHRLYGVIAGLCLVTACAVPRLQQVASRHRMSVLRAAGAALLLLFVALASLRSLEFRSEAELWEYEHRRNPQSMVAKAGIAEHHMRAERYADARAVLQDLLVLNPRHVMARRNLAQAELKLGERGSPQAAVRHARILVEGDQRNPVLRLLLSHALIALGKRSGEGRFFDEAVDSALHCLQIAEPKGLVYITAAHARMEQGDLLAAIGFLDDSVARGLDHWSVLIYRAELLARAGRRQDAAADLRRAQLQDPFAPEVRHALQRLRAGTLGGARPGR
ncbi:MAG: tetratricopeptide repeat protein [Planctomycetota bacterium]